MIINSIKSNIYELREINTTPKLREIDIDDIKTDWGTSAYKDLVVIVNSSTTPTENKIAIPSSFYDAVIEMIMSRMGDDYIKGESYVLDYVKVNGIRIDGEEKELSQESVWMKSQNQFIQDFQYKLFSILPNLYAKLLNAIRLSNQSTAYGVDVNQKGSAQIINTADAPNNIGFSVGSINELAFMSKQTAAIEKLAPIDIYSKMMQLVRADVIDDMLGRFRVLFRSIIRPVVALVPIQKNFTDYGE